MFQFKLATEVLSGENSLDKIGGNAIKIGQKAIIVTDPGVRQNGLIEPIIESLESVSLPYVIYDKVVSNPTVENVEETFQLIKAHNCDVIIAVGGGSAIDTSKSAAVVATNGGSIRDYEGIDKFSNPSLPVIAVPTTVGTGAEVSYGSVISDPGRQTKFVVISHHMFPVQAYLDPRMVENLPSPICAATGVDTLTHALESYVSLNASPISDALTLSVIEMVGKHLRPAVAGNREARYQMLVASCMAGMGFSLAGLGLVHALANTMGGHFSIHHGVANAILLPHVMEFNKIANPKKFADIAAALGENIDGLSEIDAANLAIEAVKKLSHDVGIPKTLQEVGIKEESIPAMAQDALSAVDRPPNPRRNNVNDLEALYRSAFGESVKTEEPKAVKVGAAV